MKTKLFPEWQTKILEVEQKGDGLDWVAEISGAAEDRDQQSVNQDTLKAAWDSTYKHNPILVYMHSWLGGIGTVKSFDLDTVNRRSLATVHLGKGFEIPFSSGPFGEVSKVHVDDIAAQVSQGILRSHSIGFSADAVDRSEDNLPEELLVRDWYETSVVTVPSYRRGQIVEAMAKAWPMTSVRMPSSGMTQVFGQSPWKLENGVLRGEADGRLPVSEKEISKRRSLFELEEEELSAVQQSLKELSDILNGQKSHNDREIDDEELALIVSIAERMEGSNATG